MSGLFDSIVRRRRVSASSPPGAPAEPNGHRHPVNGSSTMAESVTALAIEPTPAAEPTPVAPQPPSELRAPGFRQRAQMRRRARYLRSLREVQLRDLGGFLLELQRFERQRDELVEAKLRHAGETDAELRALERALGEPATPGELRQPGISGACSRCGAVHGSLDRFCATCGHSLRSAEEAVAAGPESTAPT